MRFIILICHQLIIDYWICSSGSSSFSSVGCPISFSYLLSISFISPHYSSSSPNNINTSPSNATLLSISRVQSHLLSPRARVSAMGCRDFYPWIASYLLGSLLLSASPCLATPVAFKGYDVIECVHKGECKVGSPKFATNYTSLDIDGTPRFIAEFRFVSVDNMIAFENAPFSYTPKYGGFCSYGIWKNGNEKPVWGRNKVGPSADVEKGWWLVRDNRTGTVDIYLFGGSKGADAFVRNLPDSKILADKVWETMGKAWHNTTVCSARWALNKVCFTGGTRTAIMTRKSFHHRHQRHMPLRYVLLVYINGTVYNA